MGGCASCIRVILEAESDVKINVIEPTTIMNEPSVVMPSSSSSSHHNNNNSNNRVSTAPPGGPLLTVPSPHGAAVRRQRDSH